MDQRYNGGKWNLLGKYAFDAKKYSVLLTDLADPGNVVADAVRISHPDNPADLIYTNFHAETRSGLAPMRVNFRAADTGDVLTWYWDFGDGTKRYSDATASHNYTKPGTYTVSLTVTGPMGKVTKTKTGYITVGSTSPPLQAEFSPPSTDLRNGPVPLTVKFTDLSSGNISNWQWDFGDGAKSTSQNPSHTYSATGNYTVKLTVADSKGNKSTETKENVIRAVVYEKKIDNVDYPKRHYGSKTILFRKELEVPKEELRFARMFYGGCSSAVYYSDTFSRGKFFYATDGTYDAEIAMAEYLKAYMTGKSDFEIWQILQSIEPLYDYYDFSKTPAQQ
jgi:PKD repeat protein